MVSAIILLLAVITAALVIGVFVTTVIELNHIDELTDPSQPAEIHQV